MKQIFASALFAVAFLFGTIAHAQQKDKMKRPSPPAQVTQTLASGATVTISYSQPSLKGRTIGKDVEPIRGQVWRMGANEATTFETDMDVTIEGQKLPAGKYSVFGLWGDDGYTIIFNKAASIWGTEYDKNKDKDALKVVVRPGTSGASQEKLTYTISPEGLVTMLWGGMVINFNVA